MAALQGLLLLAYPGLVYLGLRFLEPRQVAWIALGLAGARAFATRRALLHEIATAAALPLLAVGCVSLVTAISNDPLALLLSPAIMSFALFGVFAHSALRPPSFVERIARIQAGSLSAEETRYCRSVTLVWCAFLLLNGLLCAVLAIAGSREAWASYTGGIAYLAIALLFAAEYVLRHWRFRRYLGGPLDGCLKRLFPPLEPKRAAAAPSKPSAIHLDPELLGEHRVGDGCLLELRVPEELSCWPGHFPEQPIVPGVLQLRWVLEAVQRSTGQALRLTRIEALKFKHFVLPGDRLALRITWQPNGARFELERPSDGVIVAEGRLRFAAEPSA